VAALGDGDRLIRKGDNLMSQTRRQKPRPAVLRAVFADQTTAAGEIIVRSLAVGEWMPPCVVDRPRGRPDWLLAAFVGPVEIGSIDGPLNAPSGAVVVWRPGMPQRYGDPQREWLHAWIHLHGEGVDYLAEACGLPCGRPLPQQDLARFESTLREIHAEQSRPRPDSLLLADLVRLLIRRIARDARGQADGDVPPALLAVSQMITERFAEPLSLAGMAKIAGVSPTHLCALFRRHFGLPPVEMLLRVRIAHARELVADPRCTLADAARAVGYRDVRTFARLVRRRLRKPAGSLRASGNGG
jgi:AraC-like DNA-binding protein